MATIPTRGDVWLVDLGIVAKVRPCLVISIPAVDDNDRVLMTIVPHTASTRDSRFEVPTNVRFLKAGAFDTQNPLTFPNVKLVRRLGKLPGPQLAQVEESLRIWLGLS